MAKILIVEDNPDNQKLIGLLLRRQGHLVTVAGDAEAARAAIAVHPPELILMDIQLPGTDGLTLTTELRTVPELAGVPVVALTANAMGGDAEQILQICDGYIAKPINTRTFCDQLLPYLA